MKVKEFQEILKKKRADFAVFISSSSVGINPNMLYFSGYSGIGILVIGQKQAFMLVPEMEYEKAKQGRIRAVYIFNKKRLFEQLYAKIAKRRINKKRIGIDKTAMTLKQYSTFKKFFRKSKTTDISAICNKLREIKTNEEMQIIKKACSITDKILTRCINNFKKFKTEADVAAFLEQETRREGCSFSFQPIVASGKNSSQPHYETRKIRLNKGFCVIDFGIRYKGYCSDITRTIYLGKPSKKDIYFYHLVLNLQKEAIKHIEEGKPMQYIAKLPKTILGKYSKNFIHSLGHGVGVELHELPNLRKTSKGKLKQNSIFTVEPGIYFQGKFGIRIEDDILLGEKAEPLTTTTKDLLITCKGK